MKNIFLIATLFLAGSTSLEAQRHSHGRYDSRPGYHGTFRSERIIRDLQHDIRSQIHSGMYRNLISSREARRFMKEYDKIAARERKYARKHGMSPGESHEIIRDLESLQRQVSFATRDYHRGRSNWARSGRY